MAKEKNLTNGGLVDINIDKIIATPNVETDNSEYEIYLHTEELDLLIETPKTLDITRDYNINICDFITIVFDIPAGTFVKKIYPFRDNLEMTIAKRFKDNKKPRVSTRYKLILYVQGGMDASYFSKADQASLDESNIMSVTGQLLLREVFGLKEAYVDGVYKNCTVTDVIRGCIAQSCQLVELEGNKLQHNIDVYEANNDFLYNNLIIPTGITCLDLPSYLHIKDYGVYNGSIGTYIQKYNNKDMIFVYPLYSTSRYIDDVNYPKLTIYHANSSKYDMVDNTYRLDGKNVEIIANSKTKSKDLGSNSLMDQGDTVVSSQAEQIFNSNFEVTDEGITFDSTKQLKGQSIINRRDGQNKMRYTDDSNVYKQRAHVIRSTLAMYTIPWSYSNPDLIYPGMPALVVFEDSKKGLMKLYGTVQGISTFYDFKVKTHSSMLLVAVMSPNIYKINEPETMKETQGSSAEKAKAASSNGKGGNGGMAGSTSVVGGEETMDPELKAAIERKRAVDAKKKKEGKTTTDTEDALKGKTTNNKTVTEAERYIHKKTPKGRPYKVDRNSGTIVYTANGKERGTTNSNEPYLDTFIDDLEKNNKPDPIKPVEGGSGTTAKGNSYKTEGRHLTTVVNGKTYKYPVSVPPYPTEAEIDAWVEELKSRFGNSNSNQEQKPDKDNPDKKQSLPNPGQTGKGRSYKQEGIDFYFNINGKWVRHQSLSNMSALYNYTKDDLDIFYDGLASKEEEKPQKPAEPEQKPQEPEQPTIPRSGTTLAGAMYSTNDEDKLVFMMPDGSSKVSGVRHDMVSSFEDIDYVYKSLLDDWKNQR